MDRGYARGFNPYRSLSSSLTRKDVLFGNGGMAGGGAGAAVGEGPATQGSIRFGNRVIRSSLWEWDQCRLLSSTG